MTIYSSCSVITIGCFLYTDVGLTLLAPSGKYSDGTNCFTVVDGEVTGSTACISPTPTPTPPPSTSWTVRYATNEGDVCGALEFTVYTIVGASFTTGDTVYSDSGLTTPLVGFNFIVELITGTIYNINSGTGVIGAPTGNSC